MGSRKHPLSRVSVLLGIGLLIPCAVLADASICPPRPGDESAAGGDACRRPLVPFDNVRLKTTFNGKTLTGPIDSVDDRQITIIDRKGGKQSLPWSTVSRLDLQVGLQRQYGRMMLLGAGIGAALGLVLPLPKPDICFGESCDEPLWDREEQVAGMLVVGFLTGLIGESLSDPWAPRWERVRLPYQPPVVTSFAVGPTDGHGGMGFRVTFSFPSRDRVRTTP